MDYYWDYWLNYLLYSAMKKSIIIIQVLLLSLVNVTFAQQQSDRFESTIQEFELQDKANGYQPEAVLFTGSSSIRMWKTLKDDMSPIPVLNRGFGGSTIPEVIHYADRIILHHQPKIIVLYCGENDLSNDEAKPKLALKSLKNFHRYVNENLPETKIFFIAIKPSIRRWNYWPKFQEANSKIKKYIGKKDDIFYIDTASKMLDDQGVVLQDIFIEDNLHMNSKGYDIWTKTIKPIMEVHYPN